MNVIFDRYMLDVHPPYHPGGHGPPTARVAPLPRGRRTPHATDGASGGGGAVALRWAGGGTKRVARALGCWRLSESCLGEAKHLTMRSQDRSRTESNRLAFVIRKKFSNSWCKASSINLRGFPLLLGCRCSHHVLEQLLLLLVGHFVELLVDWHASVDRLVDVDALQRFPATNW